MILAGDIGGTKTNLAFFEWHGDKRQTVAEKTYSSGNYRSLEALVTDYLQAHRHPAECACFGVAGPVQEGRCKGVNLPWIVDAGTMASVLGISSSYVINDLESTAYSLGVLSEEDLVELNAGLPNAQGNRAVIAAGTGLGEAGLYWDGQRHHPFACEGGHCDFGARDAIEVDLLPFMMQRHDHVSWERLVSGPGLVDLYHFFRQREPERASPEVAARVNEKQAAAYISRAALQGTCPICELALDRFAMMYGAEAGNLALKLMATGGVYIGGGIAPKIIEKLKQPVFLEAFLGKGRMRYLMEQIPVRVIMTDRAALFGAAEYARLCLA